MTDKPTLKSILKKGGTWEGPFINYVKGHPGTGEKGVVQRGKWVMEIDVEGGTLIVTTTFFDQEGNQTGTGGSMKITFEGDTVRQLGETDIDPTTGNKLKEYQFEGYITENHMFLKEAFIEVVEEKKEQHRRNSLHYHLKKSNEILQTLDIYVDGNLLLFGAIELKKKG